MMIFPISSLVLRFLQEELQCNALKEKSVSTLFILNQYYQRL